VDPKPERPLDTRFCSEVRELLEGGEILWPAVGITAVVDRIDPDEDVGRSQDLGVTERERQHDRVPRRDVGHWDASGNFVVAAPLGDGNGGRSKCASPHLSQVELHGAMLGDSQGLRHPIRRLEFEPMSLTIVDAQGVERVAALPRYGRRGG
jgi:hypothetical protein